MAILQIFIEIETFQKYFMSHLQNPKEPSTGIYYDLFRKMYYQAAKTPAELIEKDNKKRMKKQIIQKASSIVTTKIQQKKIEIYKLKVEAARKKGIELDIPNPEEEFRNIEKSAAQIRAEK